MKKTSWNNLPTELKVLVLQNAPDIPTLLNLVTMDPSVESELHFSFRTILPSVLANSMPQELRDLVCALLTIREAGKFPNSQAEALLNRSLEFEEKDQLWRLQMKIGHPVAALKRIIQTQKAVGFFTMTYARCVCQCPPSISCQARPQRGDPILSAIETHRIQRGLWRFQICCELSNSWMPSGEVDLARTGSDDRIPRLMTFLKHFNPWELEELNCVYDHLETMLLRDLRDPRLDCLGNRVDPFALPAVHFRISAPGPAVSSGVKAKILSQGLTFLLTYLRQTTSRARLEKEQSLFFLSDEFVIPALRELKNAEQRFPKFCEFVISSNTGPWTENQGANMANIGWRFFSAAGSDQLCSFAYLRQFGFCMWDEQRLRSWAVLDHRYGSALNDKLMVRWNPRATRRAGVQYSSVCFPTSYLPNVS